MPLSKSAIITTILDHLEADPILAGKVHFGAVESPSDTDSPVPTPYVVVHANLGADYRERLSSEVSTQTDVSLTVMAVGEDARQALWWANAVNGRLLDYKPVVDGWKCSALTHTGSRPIDRLTDLPVPVHYSSDDYDLTARRS